MSQLVQPLRPGLTVPRTSSSGANRAMALFTFLGGLPRSLILTAALLLLAALAYLDWFVGTDISLGAFYVLPVLLTSIALNRWQVTLTACFCALLRQFLLKPPISWFDGLTGFLLGFVGYEAAGLLVLELNRHRREVEAHAAALQEQERRRTEVEQHLRTLAESSPAAIFTVDEKGFVLSSNAAARNLFGLSVGRAVGQVLPVLENALKLPGDEEFHTAAQCQGRRSDGQPFLAQTWFSTYRASGLKRLAAIAVDISEEASEREEQNLRALLTNNRIIAGAVYHELRNLCGAISLVHSRLERQNPLVAANDDFQALGNLVHGLERIAATELQTKVRHNLRPVELREVLDHLRIIIEPGWRDAGGSIDWILPARIPKVSADGFGLMQAFLNIAQNSLRATQSSPTIRLKVSVETPSNSEVHIRFEDSGPGLSNIEGLFQPFQHRSDHVGLGLYVSRSLLRGFGGDLKALPSSAGACFLVILPAVHGERFNAVEGL